MFTLQIPANGGSVPIDEFDKATKDALEVLDASYPNLTDDERAMAKNGAAAAKALLKDGHFGDEHVYAVVSANPGSAGSTFAAPVSSAMSVGVYHRPAPAKAAPVPALVVPQTIPSPYDTGPKPEEIAREAGAQGRDDLLEVGRELGAKTVVTSETKDGVTTTTVHDLTAEAQTKKTGKTPAAAKPAKPPTARQRKAAAAKAAREAKRNAAKANATAGTTVEGGVPTPAAPLPSAYNVGDVIGGPGPTPQPAAAAKAAKPAKAGTARAARASAARARSAAAKASAAKGTPPAATSNA